MIKIGGFPIELRAQAEAHGGKVVGFMPHHLQDLEDPNWAITELHMVEPRSSLKCNTV